MAKKFRMLKSTSRSEESLPQLKTEPVKSYEEKEKEKEKLRESAAEAKPVNVVTVPRYTAPPALKAGADEKQKKGCCVLS
ncbi:hypothetical protein OESDEN_10575 [Oesophagostomum dentatum]|uniref:Uncharacterized protein n=1 Tax=Oesophagostomum dentatum TaxID=61180 RepID=A0A0B1T098_OESDE|nr:hypothetical protein OESDEN_10575 [Oesophagostomum dentatum]